MDTIYRFLPIIVVFLFAFLVNPFQVDAQTFQNPAIQFNYQGYQQTGNINDTYSVSDIQSSPGRFQFNLLWLILLLLIPLGYLIWSRRRDLLQQPEPVGRGYTIAYQDIRRLKKKDPNTIKTVRRPKAF